MSLSIMHFSPSTVYSSQSPAHSHRHQPQVQRLREHDGIHQHVVLPPRSVLLLPPAPLPFGWDLATTAEGTLYYLVHNRGISNWDRPEYPAIPPKPYKHRSADCVGQKKKVGRGIGALAICLRASCTSPKILWMTVFCQGIGSLNPFQSLLPSQPQRPTRLLFDCQSRATLHTFFGGAGSIFHLRAHDRD
jgi:hypothetical protein